MAHPNIDERRAFVRNLLDAGATVAGKIAKLISERFGCSSSAILEDVNSIRFGSPQLTFFASPKTKRIVMERDRGICQYCEGRANVVEHVIPRALGGHGELYNLVAACQSCNTRKRSLVWIPANLHAITAQHPTWRERVLTEARVAAIPEKNASAYIDSLLPKPAAQ